MADRPAPRRSGSDGPRPTVSARDVVFVLAVALFVASGREDVPFHGDESTFLWMSRDAYTLAEGRGETLRFDPDTREPLAQWLRVLNGSLHPLGVGAMLLATGTERDELNEPWIWVLPRRPDAEQWDFNVAAGRLPDESLLHRARLPAALATAASVPLVFAIAWVASRSRVAAWVAVACYATNPALLLNGRRAMQEGALLFTTALVVLLALRLLRRHAPSPSDPDDDGDVDSGGVLPLPSLLALAVATGLAVAAKHAALAVVVPVWTVLACRPFLLERRPDPRVLARGWLELLGAGIASIVVFTWLSPVWGSTPRTLALIGLAALFAGTGLPLARRAGSALPIVSIALVIGACVYQPDLGSVTLRDVQHLVNERRALVAEQIAETDRSLGERVATLLREAFVAEPELFEDPAWAGFPEVEEQNEAYLATWGTGRTGAWRWLGLGVAALVAVGGLALLRRPREAESVLLLAWLFVPALALLASPLGWQRYFLPIHAPLAVLAGHGFAALWSRRGSEATG